MGFIVVQLGLQRDLEHESRLVILLDFEAVLYERDALRDAYRVGRVHSERVSKVRACVLGETS